MSETISCAICGREVEVYQSYIVRIEVLAAPESPPIDEHALPDAKGAIAELIEQMSAMTSGELTEGVYQVYEYRLCPKCHRRFINNPLGLPRRRRSGQN